MKRLQQLFDHKKDNVLNIYTTAGFPKLQSTQEVVFALEKAGADIVELGMPYSDPLADGTTIQQSSEAALRNGMTLQILFDQVKAIRAKSSIPIILMGYLNQMIQYGEERFLKTAAACGIDGMIIPDLPMDIYEESYQSLFEKYELGISFLITPETSPERILQADRLSNGFLYIVAKSNITGASDDINQDQINYFEKLKNMQLQTPTLVGFGIHDKASFDQVTRYSNGAIIGSAFIRCLGSSKIPIKETVTIFVEGIIS